MPHTTRHRTSASRPCVVRGRADAKVSVPTTHSLMDRGETYVIKIDAHVGHRCPTALWVVPLGREVSREAAAKSR